MRHPTTDAEVAGLKVRMVTEWSVSSVPPESTITSSCPTVSVPMAWAFRVQTPATVGSGRCTVMSTSTVVSEVTLKVTSLAEMAGLAPCTADQTSHGAPMAMITAAATIQAQRGKRAGG